jgi:ribosomal protein L37E
LPRIHPNDRCGRKSFNFDQEFAMHTGMALSSRIADGENTERGAERMTPILPRIHPNDRCGRKSFQFRSRICDAYWDVTELSDRIGWQWSLLVVHCANP